MPIVYECKEKTHLIQSTFKLIQWLGTDHTSPLVGLGKYFHFALLLRNNEISG